jgi:modulator of FtsH protease
MFSTTTYSGSTPQPTNRVLRNTYTLLAMSMVPTALGAWVGVTSGVLHSMGTLMSILLFFAGSFGLMYMVERNKETAAGVPWLMAFTFFMGLMLSRMLAFVLSRGNGAELVMTAFGATAAVFFAMAGLSSVIKRDLSSVSKALFIGAVLALVAGVANIFIQSSALMVTLSVIVAGIFSAFILVDLKRVRDGYETNYISATMGVYLSLYNVFSSLLQLLGIFGQDD